MDIKPRDPLLAAGKIMTLLIMGVTGIVAVLLIGIIPFLLFNQADFAKAVIEAGGQSVNAALSASIALLLLGAAVTAIAFHFFQLLGRIIDTVVNNDPFTTQNAGRLTRMGWIALTFQIASFPIAGLAAYLGDLVPAENLNVDFEFSLTGVLLALVLFILARVFRHGAEMREDLEGTV